MSEPVKVLHLLPSMEIGGLETMVLNLASGLDRRQYSPTICCFDGLGPLAEDAAARKLDICQLKRKPGIDWTYPWKLSRFLKCCRTQVLHLHNPTAFFYGTLAGKLARIPCIVYTEHGRDVSTGWKVRFAHRCLARMVDRIIVVADYGRRLLSDVEGIDDRRITVIYNGIDGGRFDRHNYSDKYDLIRHALGATGQNKLIGIVGRLDPIKNHVLLIRSVVEIKKLVPRVKLLIIGDGPERRKLESLVQELGLNDYITFLGARTDIPEILSVLDVYVLPSFSEGLSLTLVEACASGLPIVATRVGGNEEVVIHGENGLTVESDDLQGLAKAIESMLTDMNTANMMGIKGRARYERYFTLRTMINNYENVYRDCLTGTFREHSSSH